MHHIWKITLSILLAIGSGLIAWSGLVAELTQVEANGGIDWPEIELVEVTSGLDEPVHIAHAGDGSGRLFVVEQAGQIKIIENGAIQGTFLDITERVIDGGNEEGLLSVAFPPDYATAADKHFYVYYTNNDSNNVVARYGLLNADQADPNSEEIILTLNHPGQTNHNGGQLVFGPDDGYLYLAPGDGGGSGDPNNNAQNLNSLLGKILRIDVETGNPATYTIPTSNPFTQTAGARDEIWALGLRNPWRFSFDRQTGDLYIGDVGQGDYEEIDFQPAASSGGENYGWRILEGNHCFNPSPECVPPANYSAPILEYEQDVSGEDNCSVTGGLVYRGSSNYRMQGVYFYGDFCSGRIWGLKQESGVWHNVLLSDTSHRISTFGEDENGNLYLAHRADNGNGTIFQIVDTGSPNLSPSTKSASPVAGDPGESFTFTITLINNGSPLTEPTIVTDTLPTGLSYVPNTLNAAFGTVNNSGNTLFWQGLMNPTSTLQITYQVTATGEITGVLHNTVTINAQTAGLYTRIGTVIISPKTIYLPLIFK